MDVVNWSDELKTIFGDPMASDKDQSWEDIKLRYPPESDVKGKVIAQAPFGVWVDLKLGFPALIEIVVIEKLTPEKYRHNKYCGIGEIIESSISHYVDSRRQVYLKQREWPLSRKSDK